MRSGEHTPVVSFGDSIGLFWRLDRSLSKAALAPGDGFYPTARHPHIHAHAHTRTHKRTTHTLHLEKKKKGKMEKKKKGKRDPSVAELMHGLDNANACVG